uniref:Reverse transcriptase domain-containing protein n=1 Tax=Tanacetum cinerariifolium TaxID=118510 RepID=A0A699J423_TANCI|nr:hypothetical protein [Tanacetum cinerariifolium]
MEDTILELVEICRQKELYCMHDNVDDLIESALNFKLLLINSQRLNKEKQKVKNVVEQPAERRTQPEYSPNMEYEHLSTTPKTKLDEVTEFSAKNLLPIPSECEVTSEDEKIADMIIESLPSLPIPVQDGDSQREEINIVTKTDDVLPSSVENDDDSEEDIYFLEELLSDNSIPLTEDESSNSDHQDDPSFPRPPPKPPDAKPDSEEEIPVVMNDRDEFNDKNGDYFLFMFFIRIFLPYLICSKMFLSFLSAESKDTIFDPGIFV